VNGVMPQLKGKEFCQLPQPKALAMQIVYEEHPDNRLTGDKAAIPFSDQNSSSKELMSRRARTVRRFKDCTFAGC